MPLEYAGFCPVALVSGQGFVLPGNRRIGYLGHNGKFYSPSTVDRAEQVNTFFNKQKKYFSWLNSLNNFYVFFLSFAVWS